MRALLIFSLSVGTCSTGFAQEPEAKQAPTAPLAPKAKADQRPKSDWFPDWGQPEFDWFVRPVIGLQYADSKSTDGSSQKSTALEIGLQGGLSGVPLVKGNPGLVLEPTAGYSYGNITQVTRDASAKLGNKTETGAYHRSTVGLAMPFNAAFYKLTPRLSWGRIQGKLTPQRVSLETSLDHGFLLRSFLSTHLTTSWLRLSGDKWSENYLKSFDIWWSIRAFSSIAKAQIAVGPGITWSDFAIYSDGKHLRDYAIRSTDLRLVGSAHLFWKLGASLNSKYTISSTAEAGQSLKSGPLPDLPSQNLGEPSRITTKETDSLASTAFLGLSDVFYGIGFGYFHSLWIESLTGGGPKGTTQGKTTQSSGVGVHYEAKF